MRATKPLPEMPGPHETFSTGLPSLHHQGSEEDMSGLNFGYLPRTSVKSTDSQPSLRSKSLPQPLRSHPTSTNWHRQNDVHEQIDSSTAVVTTPDDTEPPRKYRLKNKPSSLDLCTWQGQDDTPLTEILKQERSAWSTRSPTNTTYDDNIITSGGPESWHLPSDANSIHSGGDHQHASKRQRLTPNRRVLDHDSEQLHLNYHRVSADSGNIMQRSHDHQEAVRIPAKRTSSFFEGSMNENSRGVASTWTPPSATSITSTDHTSLLSDSDDGESTPRASAASRASTSSSIDINEFKPLPATPSTFKNTVKRLGQKLRNPETTYSKSNEPCPTIGDRQKGRLRKSVSTWKIFGSHTPASEPDEKENPIAKQSRGGRTLRALRNVRAESSQTAQAEADAAYKAILDERKRKAEAIYAEQYSTVRKRQKQVDPPDENVAVPSRSTDTAAVRKQKSSGLRTINTTKTGLRRANSEQEMILDQTDHTSTFQLSTLPEPMPTAPCLAQAHSRANHSILRPSTDHLKKPTITELEKENQHLRTMLREKSIRTVTGRSRHHIRRKSASDQYIGQKEEMDERPKSSSGVEGVDDKLSRFTELVRGLDSMQKHSVHQTYPDDLSCMPSHPERTTPLSSKSARASADTSTMKRRTPLREHNSSANLPRPLSMVLEGIETDDGGATADSPKSSKALAGKDYQYASYDGSIDEENVSHARVEGTTRWNEHSGSKVQQWQWPEDVF